MRIWAGLFLFLVLPAICLAAGTDFWTAVPDIGTDTNAVQVLITTQTDNTTGTIQITGLSFSQNFTVSSGQVAVVSLPAGVIDSTSDQVHNLSVHITATNEIAVVCGFLAPTVSNLMIEATPVLPVESLGTEYWTLGYAPDPGIAGSSTHMLIVAPLDQTTVTITPSVTASGHPAGTPYNVMLNTGDQYQLRPADDLSGSHIVSDKPVAVFSSGNLIRIPVGTAFASGLWEQIPPVPSAGTEYLIAGLAGRQNGDRYRFLALADNATVTYNGNVTNLSSAGQFFEVAVTGPVHVTSTQPVLVAQFAHSENFDNQTGGAMMSYPPPLSRLGRRYAAAFGANVASTNHINIVTPDSAVGQIQMDGTPIPAGSFTAIGTTGYSYAQIAATAAEHTFDGPADFAVTAYGFTDFQGYGYSPQPLGLPCVFGDDFQSGVIDPGMWTIIKAAWSESAGNLVGTPTGRKAIIIATGFPGCAGACTIGTSMQSAGGAFSKVWMLAWYVDKKNAVELLMDEQKNKWTLKHRVNGVVLKKGKVLMAIDPLTLYDVELSFDGTNFQLSVSGNQVLTLAPGAPPQGTVGFESKNTTGSFGSVCVH